MKNVIFDFGKVLINWDPYLALSSLFSDRAEMALALARIDFDGWNAAQDLGRSWEDGLADVRKRFPADVDIFVAYAAGLDAAHSQIVPGMDVLLDRLAAAGVDIFGLTNAARESLAAVRRVLPQTTLMRDIVCSGEVGVMKPDLAIYRLLLERNGLAAIDCVFIDDKAENCDAARVLGFDAILFVDPAGCEAALSQRGLL